jgi:hypothetical protein
MIVITCGTNDIDHKPGERVASELINIVKRVRKEHPQSKLVVSEATPRSRTRDDQIQTCNYILHQRLQTDNYVTIAEQHGLRNADWSLYEDDKHISREHINTYAGNLKLAMRKARKGMITTRPYHTASHMQQFDHCSTNHHTTPVSHSTSHVTHPVKPGDAPPLMSLSVPVPKRYAHTKNHNIGSDTTSFLPMGPLGHPGPMPLPPVSAISHPLMSTRAATPIGARLRKISECTEEYQEANFRGTIIEKLSDLLKCIQG